MIWQKMDTLNLLKISSEKQLINFSPDRDDILAQFTEQDKGDSGTSFVLERGCVLQKNKIYIKKT
jgi:hypothetical protein